MKLRPAAALPGTDAERDGPAFSLAGAPNCGPGRSGGDDVSLMIIVKPYNVRRLRDDGTLLPDSDTESQ